MEAGSQGGLVRKMVGKKKSSEDGNVEQGKRIPSGERTVKRLRMSKALTVPDNITVYEACRRMAARKVDAVLIIDSNSLLCGILTYKDIAARVVAAELELHKTAVAKVMTRNPVFVLSDTLSIEALQKMVQGKFRHLPVVENGEVIALLDITKCLYDVIDRMERTVQKGKAIATGTEIQCGTSVSGPNHLLETIQQKMFRPCVSEIISGKTIAATVSPTDSVLTAAKKMLELKVSSAVITNSNKPQGILTPRDILVKVIAQNLSIESTPVEMVMTPNPECATVDTPIIDAIHTMHAGKFLHLPVVDRDGSVVAVSDVIQITEAAVSMVGITGIVATDTTNMLMRKFWDTVMSLAPLSDEDDSHSDEYSRHTSEGTEIGKPGYVSGMGTTFGFKVEDKKGRMHRFNCDTGSMAELIACMIQRIGDAIDWNHLPYIMYEDEEHDKVLLLTDSDLATAIEKARISNSKCLRLYLDFSNSNGHGWTSHSNAGGLEFAHKDAWAAACSTVAAGAALIAGLGVMAYLRRDNS